jgi:hypothetical protein
MFGMRFSISGRSRERHPEPPPREEVIGLSLRPPLTTVRVGRPRLKRALGRRDVQLVYERVFIPSAIIDHTELMLRQHGVAGEEGFGLWAGTLAGGNGFVSTLVVPTVAGGKFRGEITNATAARVFDELDALDLVPIAQIHSHPQEAFLSHVDAERPFVAVSGFLSLIVPDFGFADLADVRCWRAYEFHGRNNWRELNQTERLNRLIIDPSLLRID